MCITRHLLGHRLLCMVCLYKLHLEKWQCYCCIWMCPLCQPGGENVVFLLLRPVHQLGESAATAAAPARREVVLVRLWYGHCSSCCTSQERIIGLQFLWLLRSSPSLLLCALPTLDSANSVNSKRIGTVNRISDTWC